MEKVWVYILQSDHSGRYYCGQTSDLKKRIEQHNDQTCKITKTTKRFQGPWKLIWAQKCPNRSDALKLEKTIKKRGILRFLEEHKKKRILISGSC